MPVKRMTEREYMERVAGLFEKVRLEFGGTENDASLYARFREAEFNLTVEYRLGPDFPVERRAALWIVQRQVEERIDKLREEYLAGSLQQQEFGSMMERATKEMAEVYATVLTPKEMKEYFGDDEGAFKVPFSADEGE